MAYRYGVPRTEAERAERHVARFGTTELPPRGTGRLASRNPWIAVGVVGTAAGLIALAYGLTR